ncbi:tyrosine aminotransferase-like [Ctenocephalides felis]|uniref:tyrosine aminotransferase-like n=1 Tax=Ctenocephalides felis TaxID=7515 RepID=UPI000E6E4D6D|nr:tyrosine aminotransferase-like [Ctenocephalides felis]
MSPGTENGLKPIAPFASQKRRWDVKVSKFATNTVNPIREIVDNLKLEPNPDKQMIALSIGDPTVFGNLKPHSTIPKALCKALESGKNNGYGPAVGFPAAREAVAKYSRHQGPVTAQDVILCSGCSCALDMCISVLANPGENILMPRPGFSIYRTLAEGMGIQVKYYNLLPEREWEVDLQHMRSQIDDKTRAMIVNNPSNPCGSVYTADHLRDILDIASEFRVPIIADEIYEHFVFPGNEFHSMASLSDDVPILSCGGLTKRFLIPGWRMGWIIINDRNDVFKGVRKGLQSLSTRIIGSNTLVQGALPEILADTPQEYYDDLVLTLARHAKLAYEMLKDLPGLTPVMPQGAMYMMIGLDMENFPEYKTEMDLVQELVKEQSVFCLPGQCFEYPNYMRMVLTVPEEMIEEACKRIAEFCEQHYKMNNNIKVMQI